jgi:hypothetical protein
MSAIELWAFITAVTCVGIHLALDGNDDDVIAWTPRLTARKRPRSR